MYCVIGSHAINRQLHKKIGKLYRKPVDLDLLCTIENAERFATENFSKVSEKYLSPKGGKMVVKGSGAKHPHSNITEIELIGRVETAQELYDLILNDPETIIEGEYAYASMDVCYMLKMSHRYLKNNPHFIKTMRDIHNLRTLGASIPKKYKKFLKERERVTYWYKHPKLNKDKMDFFNGDGVVYLYDHDAIHESVKRDVAPAYTFFQSENAEVMCDMKKFFELPEQVRLNAVYEESCVLALERSIIPFGTPYNRAFAMALEKVCTSITSGKFREFAWENYLKVRDMYDSMTFDKFFDDVLNDKVKMHDNGNNERATVGAY